MFRSPLMTRRPYYSTPGMVCFVMIVSFVCFCLILYKYLLCISRKERIRNVTIRQQIGLEETIIKETEQNQLTWYGHVQRMAEGRLPKIALKWMPKQKRAWGRPKKNWMEGIRKAMNERTVNEGQWKDRKQWSLGVAQRRKTFWDRYIYIYIYIMYSYCYVCSVLCIMFHCIVLFIVCV